MFRSLILCAALTLLAACEATTPEPISYNAGDWQSAPTPGGTVTIFSLDTSGTAVRGAGSSTGSPLEGKGSFAIQGERTFRYWILSFTYRDSSTYTYVASFDGPDRLIGSVTDPAGLVVDSVLFLRR